MTKAHILEEIRRMAKENGGVALGINRFAAETGIRLHECVGVYWAKWSDALAEAGYSPNKMTAAIDDEVLLRKYGELVQRLGRAAAKTDIRLAKRSDPNLPSTDALVRRFGSMSELRRKTKTYCESTTDLADVVAILAGRIPAAATDEGEKREIRSAVIQGYVYLIRHGGRREYKIGRTNNPLRREGEIGLELPERALPIHKIATDDPAGIEAYWHRRFEQKRKNGEWFELSIEDVAAFKRRQFM